MKILLIVTSGSDVFVHNYAKWLEKTLDCTIDAFELYPSSKANQKDSSGIFKKVETANWDSWWGKNKITRFLCSHYGVANQLDRFLSDKEYDIIHVHGVWFYVPFVKTLKIHTRKLFVSFWGAEYKNGKVWKSHRIFESKLKSFIRNVDGIINTKARLDELHTLYPTTKLYHAILGAASMETILELDKVETKESAKNYWGIPDDKITVLIGYSGKKIHNHLEIINEFHNHPNLLEKIHLLAPMTRGANTNYADEVEIALSNSGFSYTLMKDRFLSDNDIAQLRRATDIVFQFANSDAYSRSIVECICAGALLIYGNWINYNKFLSDDGFAAIEVENINKGIEVLKDFLYSKDKYRAMCASNMKIGGKKFLWSECIKDWVDIYTGNQNAEVF